MGLIDIIFFPIYVVFFALLFAARRKRIQDPLLKKYHLHGFWIKVFSAIAYCIFSVYLSKGDSTYLYYPEGFNITKLILKDVSNINLLFIKGENFDTNLLADTYNKGYFRSDSNYLIARIVAVSSFFCFGSYSVVTLFFSMISFSGVWRLYKFFYELYPHLHKQLALAIIYLPTFIFWSSGILKDPLCTGMMGWLTYSLYQLLLKRKGIVKNILIFFVSATVLAVVKSYILFSYLPLFLLFIVLTYLKNINNVAVKAVAFFFITIMAAGSFYVLQNRLQEEMGDLALDKISESVQTTQQNFEGVADLAESSFSLGVEFDGTPGSLLRIAPAGINATLFRPYLWESKKLSTLLSSLESLTLMLLTLYVFFKAGPFKIIGSILKDPMIMFCMLFAITFAIFIGVTTLNFGTLVRYKTPCMPFYIIGLILILQRVKEQKAALLLKNTTADPNGAGSAVANS